MLAILLAGCDAPTVKEAAPLPDVYGTLEPFAAEAIYFLLTDRFVDGDPSNNFESQGAPAQPTFDRPIQREGLPPGNIGYLGGDFKGVLQNAAYIADLGFTAIWLTPIVDNPDESFSGDPDGNDFGKTGYHGYWGVNFFQLDEHLPSPGLDYAALTRQLRDDHQLKVVLDVVCNHGSPSFTMPTDQAKYGELYDASGSLVADHQNLHPADLDPGNPLHAFFRREPDIGVLSDLDYDNPEVLDYCVAASLKWLQQGAAAIRLDTIKHMPHHFWKAYSDRIRAERPDLFIFGEAFTYEPQLLAEFTRPENGGNSVLDFLGRESMLAVFGSEDAPYSQLQDYLHLDSGLYENPYELITFYDNHDMSRLDADESGFIDANNWLFTSRGIPAVYYGSEIGFRAGRPEHSGNRDYLGQSAIDGARSHPVHAALRSIASLRRDSVALQRGLQINLAFTDTTATLFRVYQKQELSETALVLLNKSDAAARIPVGRWLAPAIWKDRVSEVTYAVSDSGPELVIEVPGHGVVVLFSTAPVTNPDSLGELRRLQRHTTP